MKSHALAGKVVLVTGGTGSIGRELVVQALKQGADRVIVFSRDEIKHFLMRREITEPRLETVVGDVRDFRTIQQGLGRFDIDIIYHAAAMKHVVMCDDFPLEAVKTNILGTQNIVDFALQCTIPKVITISTDKTVYPVNVMGAAKFIAERITLNANKLTRGNQAFACVRFGNVANSRGSVIPVFIGNLLNSKPLRITDRAVTRFNMEISDAVNLIIRATEYAHGGEIFILKMRAFRLGDLVDVICDRIAPRLNIRSDNIRTISTGLVVGEKLHEELLDARECLRAYEWDDMLVIVPNSVDVGKYPAMRKAAVAEYSSRDAEMMGMTEVEETVLRYLRSIGRATDRCEEEHQRQ